MDRVTVVRSLTHPYPVHGVAYAVSGIPTYTPALEVVPRDARHWPFIGSVVDYLEERRTRQSAPAMPRNVGLPWLLNAKTDLGPLAGPYAAFLGQGHDPVWADFDGPGTRPVPHYTSNQKKTFIDPYGGVTLEGRFQLSRDGRPMEDVASQRLASRRSLLEQ